MNTIIGYIEGSTVYLATDTARKTGNDYSFSDATEAGLSIFNLPQGAICGVSGLCVKQVIQTNTQWFDGLENEPLTKKFIVQNIIPKLYKKLDKLEMVLDKDKGRSEANFSALLAQEERLFCIDPNFSVYTIPKFCIIGKGRAYAFPRIALRKDEPIEEILYNALNDAKAYSRHVRDPYYMLTTDRCEKTLLKRN